MGKIIVKKCKELNGEVNIHGSKNAALPIIAATVLAEKPVKIYNIPEISDIKNMENLLSYMGFSYIKNGSCVEYKPSEAKNFSAPETLTGKLRGSVLLAGPMLAKYGKINISYPGGCSIGLRPVDLHLKGFESLGAKIETKHGNISITAKKLKGNRIYLDFPSVGATENLIMAATLAEGETLIENAATEPEITDLCDFLIKLGAEISGVGTKTIKITGKDELGGATHSVIPDRIEAGTFMIGAAAVKGDVTVNNIICEHLKPIILKLKETGVTVEENENSIRIISDKKLYPTDIKTLPHPGFPTDMQAAFSVLLSQIKGTSIITESVFENRFQHISELNKMGALIKTDGRCAIIEGSKLSGAKIKSSDLRSGAALVLAGLCANGETVIDNYENILRGYENFDGMLKKLGADIRVYN